MKLIYTALILLLCTCVRAQTDGTPALPPNTGGVGGELKDATTTEPVGFANIAVYNVADGTLISGTTSDIDGKV